MKVAPEEVKENLLFAEVRGTDIGLATGLSCNVIVVPAGGPVDFAVTRSGELRCLGLIRCHPVRSVLPKEKSPA